jgi:RNA polymerase sigma-70 factor, ECF subfamily
MSRPAPLIRYPFMQARRNVDFQAAYGELYAPLVRYMNRFTGDAEVAEDLTQDAFVRLLGQELPDREVKAWIFTVATNLAVDHKRKWDRRRTLLAVNRPMPQARRDPEQQAAHAEEVARVRAALETLRPRDRQMLLMREEGFKYAEIAEAVGVLPRSVGTLVSRALKRFKEAYEGQSPEPREEEEVGHAEGR